MRQIILSYNDYIFEKKLDFIFSNINENDYTDTVWDNIENKISKSNSNFWNIVNSIEDKYKKILGILLDKSLFLLKNINSKKVNLLLNKLLQKIYQLIKPDNIKKKLIYAILIFITSLTLLSMKDISIDDTFIRNDVNNILKEMPTKTIKNIPVKTIDNVPIKPRPIIKPTEDFFKKLAFKESSGEWNKIRYVTKNGEKIPVYVGKYQFGNTAFKDINSDIRVSDFEKNPNIWTSEQQDKDLIKLLKNNKHYLRNYKKYIGKIINGIEITESGILAAAHLVGNGGVKRFLKSNGEIDPVDGNGTKCSHYIIEFNNYKLPI